MKRNIYSLVAAAMLTPLCSEAQIHYFGLDSTFSATGIKILNASPNHADVISCLLLDDGKSLMAGTVTNDLTATTALETGGRLKINGDFDSTLCGSYCTSSSPHDSRTTGIYALNAGANFYYASSGFGGNVVIGSATDFDDQRYSLSLTDCAASAKYNDTIVIAGGVEGTGGILYAYKVNAALSGYAGAPGIITDGAYPHGGTVAPFTSSILTTGIQYLGVQTSGKILAAGYVRYGSLTDTGAFVCRFKLNSLTLDSTFGVNGIVYLGATATTPIKINAFYVASDDKIYLQCTNAGSTSTFMQALAANGTVYTAFGTGGTVTTGTTTFSKMRMIDGRLVCGVRGNAAGDIAWAFNTDGTEDTTFGIGTNKLNISSNISSGSAFSTRDISANAANEILIAGHFTSSAGVQTGTLVKLKKKLRPTPPPPTGISNTTAATISVSPNPATNYVRIDADKVNGTLKVKVSSLSGATVMEQEIENHGTIKTDALPGGMYILHVNDGNEMHTLRLIKD